jgi:hypothetical protein
MPPEPRFLADSMLGKLARWLRALGGDAAYERALDDAALVERARAEGRVLLTRDRRLLQRRRLARGFLVESDDPSRQLAQIARAFDLRPDPRRRFRRCLECNVEMSDAARDDVRDRVPPYVLATQSRFARCPACGRIFWAATHVEEMRRRLDRALRLP